MIGTGDIAITDDVHGEAEIARILAARQAAISAPPAEQRDDAAIPHLRWSIGAARFASPIAAIREVAALPRFTPVPGAPPALLGIVAWRGAIANLFDPAAALGVAAAEPRQMLVLAGIQPIVALAVSAIDDAVALSVADADPGPSITRIITLEGSPVSLVSIPKIAERLIARRAQKEG